MIVFRGVARSSGEFAAALGVVAERRGSAFPGAGPRAAAQCLNGQMEAMDWLRGQGVVLQSARGPVPNLAEQDAGERIRGSWWGHPAGHEIFNVLEALLASGDVVVARLINGRVTLIHRRVWPALVRIADRFPAERLAAVDEVHTASGAHRAIAVPFPEWVPGGDISAAALLTIDEALAMLPPCLH